MGWFGRKQKEPVAAPTVDPDFKAKNAARIEMERRQAYHEELRDDALSAVHQAQTWLDEHPKTHSARRGDVKRLMRAVEGLLEEL